MTTSEELNTDSLVPERKIYRDTMIWLGTFLGGPLVAGYIIAENFKALGMPEKVTKTWIFTILATILIFTIAILIPDDIRGLNGIIPIAYISIAALILNHLQGKQILLHIEAGGQAYRRRRVVVIGFIGLVITIVAITVSICILYAIM